MNEEPIFQPPQNYPSNNWVYIFDKCVENLDRHSVHELWQEMTQSYRNSLLERQHKVKENRLIKTITPANVSKLPVTSEIWSAEEALFGAQSALGKGVGTMDTMCLYKNVEGYFTESKALRKRKLPTIEEENGGDDHLDSKRHCSSTGGFEFEDVTGSEGLYSPTETCGSENLPETENVHSASVTFDSEDVRLVGGLQIHECGPQLDNALKLEDCAEMKTYQPPAMDVEPSPHSDSHSWAEMVEEEMDAKIRSELYINEEEEMSVTQEADQNFGKSSDEADSGPAATGITEEERLMIRLASLALERENSQSDQDYVAARGFQIYENGGSGEKSGQLKRHMPELLSERIDFRKYLSLQRNECVARGDLVLRLDYSRRCTSDYRLWKRQMQARKLELDNRTSVREIFPDDVKDSKPTECIQRHNRCSQQSPISALSTRIHIVSARFAELKSILDSAKLTTELCQSVKKAAAEHYLCHLRYQEDRLALLVDFTSPKLSKCFRRDELHQVVQHALFLDELVFRARESQRDPERRLWKACKDWDELEQLYCEVKERIKEFEERGETEMVDETISDGDSHTTPSADASTRPEVDVPPEPVEDAAARPSKSFSTEARKKDETRQTSQHGVVSQGHDSQHMSRKSPNLWAKGKNLFREMRYIRPTATMTTDA